ncbi:MAG: 2-dehydropantoate 2-reductase [Anaerolineales bacterium]|nr:2-dehydropantoate 2-reductase [Anaerolineales bacterium]
MRLSEPPEVVIAGAGAMACMLAAHVYASLNLCILDSWKEGVDHIQNKGIRLDYAGGSLQTPPIRAVTDPQRCRGTKLALVLVKSWQTEQTARQLKQCLRPDGHAITLQNGLGNLQMLGDVLGEGRVFQGITFAGATLLGPGHVRLAGRGPIYLPSGPQPESLGEALIGAGFEVFWHDSLEALQWRKLVVNSSINPLTALLRVTNGRLLEEPHVLELMCAIAAETAEVARASGVRLDGNDPAQEVRSVAEATADNRSSMLQDIDRGAPTEIDAINGAVVRAAEATGLPAPYNRTMWSIVRGLTSRYTGASE